MDNPSVRGDVEGQWLALGEAARLLGVDETTLRGWADAGKVKVFRTPGGHRRFSAADLHALIGAALPAAGRPEGSPAAERIEQARAPASLKAWMSSRPWFTRLDQAAVGRVRAQCMRLMHELSAYLDHSTDRPQRLAEGRRIGADLGHEVAGWGLTPAQSAEVFTHFKMMVTDLLAAPPLGTSGQVRSMRDADAFLGEVLQAMMEAYGAAGGMGETLPE